MGRSRVAAALGSLSLILFAACAAPPPPAPVEPAASEAETFGEAAWRHLEALVSIGPRVPGTPGAERARAYLEEQLEAIGIGVSDDPRQIEDRGDGKPIEAFNLLATLGGESSDLFVLAARYDTKAIEEFEYSGANAASGAALLLELARTLSEDPLPYTVWFVFLGGDAPQGDIAPESGLWASRHLVSRLQDQEELDRVRIAVFFDQVADADLAIARDLRSHRVYREAFFRAAERLDAEQAFPSDAGFDSVVTGHLSLLGANMRRVVAIKDPRYGGDEPPGTHYQTEQDTLEQLSPESLGVVGTVSERALRDIAALLRRVDRFAKPRSRTAPAPDSGEPEAEASSVPDGEPASGAEVADPPVLEAPDPEPHD